MQSSAYGVWTLITAFAISFLCPQTTWVVCGAPTAANSDSNDTTFPLELQLPLIDDAADADFNGVKKPSSIDSYGNPVDTLKPIETPDGRKVVSAQGLQFEIPNYASGITEIKQPADDLLPPFIDPIAVAETSTADTDTSTRVEIENAHVIELPTSTQAPNPQQPQESQQQEESVVSSSFVSSTSSSVVPDYLLSLNDPNIGGPTAYVSKDDGSVLKVIAWDLLPPSDAEIQNNTKDNLMTKPYSDPMDPKTKESKSQRTGILKIKESSSMQSAKGRVDAPKLHHGFRQENITQRKNLRHQENQNTSSSTAVHHKSRSTTPTPTRSSKVITTSTRRPTIATSTTYRPTTSKTTAKLHSTQSIRQKPITTTVSPPTKIATTTAPLDPSTFYKLAAGDSYTLPSWLADVNDPDLDAAVLYVVPDDLKEYNATIANDILPPLEPFVDLKNIHLEAPANEATTQRVTTKATTTKHPMITQHSTSTTRSTSSSSSRPHWIRDYATTTTSTTQKPTAFVSDLSPTPSTSNMHQALSHQSKTSTTPTTSANFGAITLTQLQKQHQPHHNHYQVVQTPSQPHKPSFSLLNKNLPDTAADDSDDPAPTTPEPPTPIMEKQFGQRLPLLADFNDQSPSKPFHSAGSRRYTTTTTLTTTTRAPFRSTTQRTTTSTTTKSPQHFAESPFDSSTIPTWLSDFEYDDIGPGVDFNYDPAEVKHTIYNDLLPPTNLDAQATDNIEMVPMTTSPATFHYSFNPSQSTIHPSSVTLTHSFSTNSNDHNNNNYDENEDDDERSYPIYDSITEPSILFVPPSIEEDSTADPGDDSVKNTSTSFTQNLPAAFAPNPDLNAKTMADVDGRQEESFPPLDGSNGATNASNVPLKTTFSKSNDGKVITNNIFLNAASGSPQAAAVKPFVVSDAQKDFQAEPAVQTPAPFSGFSASASGFSKPTTRISVNPTAGANTGGHYTGRFGGPPGVLGSGKIGYAVQADGSIRDPDHTHRPSSAEVTAPLASPRPTSAAFANHGSESYEKKYHGSFGGPPGILVPYDNNKASKS